jgi:thymidylate synthase
MAWKSIVTELLWFLRGDTNIKFLLDYDCHIWDGDAYKHYVICTPTPPGTPARLTKEEFINKIKTDNEFAKVWGELGPIYGKQWREWETYDNEKAPYLDVDQIANLINELKTNPDSRRLMVSAWNVGELEQMVLPPCHYGFQVYTQERENKRYISLMWNQRSVDTFLGLPFNIASYALLLEIIAKQVNMIPDELIGNLGDVHLYNNHLEQAAEQCSRHPFELPTLQFTTWANDMIMRDNRSLDWIIKEITATNNEYWFKLENYQFHPAIKAPLSN